MEDIVSEVTAQALNQLADRSVEQARQEFERAMEEDTNALPINAFGGTLSPVGSAGELHYICTLLRDHRAELSVDELIDRDNLVYNVQINEENGQHHDYWVNDYWHNQLLIAAGVMDEVMPEEAQLSPEEEAMLAAALESEHQEIPVNSQTITVDETTSRFSGAIWYEQIQQQTVTLAGVGGIGSYVGFLLGRLKPQRLIIYDPDRVETVNMSGQLYGQTDVGNYKSLALANMVRNYANYNNIVALNDRFEANSEATDIMICGFDNMTARRTFYEKWKQKVLSYPAGSDNRKKCLFIDGRLAAEEFQVLSIQGDDERAMVEYEDKWLFSDAEAEETICSYKQTTFMANMIASVMVNVFVNFVANQCGPIIDRDVPFFISYDASTMFTKVEM
jgi:hypothetical protein